MHSLFFLFIDFYLRLVSFIRNGFKLCQLRSWNIGRSILNAFLRRSHFTPCLYHQSISIFSHSYHMWGTWRVRSKRRLTFGKLRQGSTFRVNIKFSYFIVRPKSPNKLVLSVLAHRKIPQYIKVINSFRGRHKMLNNMDHVLIRETYSKLKCFSFKLSNGNCVVFIDV